MRVTADLGSPVRRIRLDAGGHDSTGREHVVASAAGLRDLAGFVAAADADRACRLIVIEAGDGGFCRGMDLEAIAGADPHAREHGIRAYVDCLRELRGCGTVLACLVDGMTLGAGLGIAASCDFVLATERSRFGLPELVLGLVPAIVLSALLDRMSVHQARRLALAGGTIPAHEAQSRGLADAVVPDANGLAAALRSLARDVRRTHPDAVSRWKRLCRELGSAVHERALEQGAACTRERLADPDVRAGVAAFAAGSILPLHGVEEAARGERR